MKAFLIALVLALVALTGCSSDLNSTEAVHQGVLTHLAGVAGLDVSQMDIEVTSVAFGDDEAEATVSFRPRGSTDPGAGMEMTYTLEQQGNHWVVRGRSESSSPHGEGMMEGEMPGGELPPGHPPMSEMPPGDNP